MRARPAFCCGLPTSHAPIPATGLGRLAASTARVFAVLLRLESVYMQRGGEKSRACRASADLKMAGDNHLLSKVLSKVIFCATLPVTRWLLLLAELDGPAQLSNICPTVQYRSESQQKVRDVAS